MSLLSSGLKALGKIKVGGVSASSIVGGIFAGPVGTIGGSAATGNLRSDFRSGALNAGKILTQGPGALKGILSDVQVVRTPAAAQPSAPATLTAKQAFDSVRERIETTRELVRQAGSPAPPPPPTLTSPAILTFPIAAPRTFPLGAPTAAPAPVVTVTPSALSPASGAEPVSLLSAAGKLFSGAASAAPRVAAAASAAGFRFPTIATPAPMALAPSLGSVASALGGLIGRAAPGGVAGAIGGGVINTLTNTLSGGMTRTAGGSGCGCNGRSHRDPCTQQKTDGGKAPLATFFGGCCPPGRVLRRTSWGRDICAKVPRMNPFNPRALARADRRITQFARRTRPILRSMGYQVTPARKVKLTGKKRRARR